MAATMVADDGACLLSAPKSVDLSVDLWVVYLAMYWADWTESATAMPLVFLMDCSKDSTMADTTGTKWVEKMAPTWVGR